MPQVPGRRLLVLAVTLAVAVLYVPLGCWMVSEWHTHPYAGHGMFVPAIAAVILWGDRARLRAAVGPESPAGLVLLGAALAILALGHATGSLLLGGLSVPIAVAGLVVWVAGPRALRVAAFPVAFLALMSPLPRPLVAAVTLDLQLFAAGFAARALDLLGIPAYLDGELLQLPAITLRIAEACNGLRFLTAILVLTIAFAHITQRSLGRKLLLVAAAVLSAIVANAVRVTAIALATEYWGPEAASGWIHHGIGKGVWALTLLPLLALGWWLAADAYPSSAPLASNTLSRGTVADGH
jgi:exosortase